MVIAYGRGPQTSQENEERRRVNADCPQTRGKEKKTLFILVVVVVVVVVQGVLVVLLLLSMLTPTVVMSLTLEYFGRPRSNSILSHFCSKAFRVSKVPSLIAG